ncbi:sulfite oxidase-like oxidoreductase [Picrophilus oshimae]|uniref:Oxidoreductase molybdopterin binding domain-containing protein n=1 Tax=Picrophilus torridus (strain ATCC 700027 / DSM 9790 / JCM 10055 / NBRC 100828 / KAW 2/3) TaxID=1122961 RepID=A0A8G2L7B8_PICTO|nr:sulfite oxidase-like oxidoreductase [Picrophilus oshimae]SMD30165.1 Oxidoreductase molybdopterin binding domain-containing protein [Picrophilus oshimae DSM 9789]
MEKIEIKNPGQVYARNFIIYEALGEPVIKKDDWDLKVYGHVKKEIIYKFNDLESMPQENYIADFNCVTKWSIRDVKWQGPSLKRIIEASMPDDECTWVMFECADGYDTPVPLEDALDEKSIIAIKMNDEYLSVEQGFPARPFIPSLYGWKSAKWLTGIRLMHDYEDGYWEMYGYHERGKIENEERFKGFSWKFFKRSSKLKK